MINHTNIIGPKDNGGDESDVQTEIKDINVGEQRFLGPKDGGGDDEDTVIKGGD